MIQVKFTQEQKEALNYERYHHPNPRVQRKMEALWLKSQGESHNRIAELTGISKNAVTQYVKEYAIGGIDKLKEINFFKPESKLIEYQKTIEDYFHKHPPATLKEAMYIIEDLTGLKRCEKSIKKFLNKIGLKRRKVGTIPAKADIKKQEDFKKNN